jgi:hypothetical protein
MFEKARMYERRDSIGKSRQKCNFDTQSVDSASGPPDTVGLRNTKSKLVKQNSLCTMDEYSKHTGKAVGDIILERDLFRRTSSSISPTKRVSSGSSFYGQVVTQQQLQVSQNYSKSTTLVKRTRLPMETQQGVSWGKQIRDFLERPTKFFLCICFCQAYVNVHLYYLMTTMKCTHG